MSCAHLEQLPEPDVPEIAFAGRSNAGKSSALNAITDQKLLARVSNTPGRTQLLNYFEIAGLGRLVDLPGYGYAKVPGAIRRDWGKLVTDYIEFRQNLSGIVVIMDIRHPLTDYDRQLIGWAAEKQIGVHCLLTKCDKLGFGAAKTTLVDVRRALGPMATAQLFSSVDKTGVDEAREKFLFWMGGAEAAPGPKV